MLIYLRVMRLCILALAGLLAWPPLSGRAQQSGTRPTFRATVDRVTVAATVRDRRGRPVTTLTADDFHVFDSGERIKILEFQRDAAPVSLALLADFSGSMDVADKRAACAKLVEDHGHSNGRIRASHKHLAAAIRARREKR